MVLSRIEWEVLNATADDWENLEQIYLLLTQPMGQVNGVGPSLNEIADAICALTNAGLLEARLENGRMLPMPCQDLHYVWQAWFRMTAQGRSAWNAASPVASASD